MKHVKVYEEYTEKDIENLLTDLSSVGQVDRVKVVCLMKTIIPQSLKHPSLWTNVTQSFAIAEFPDRGSDESNKKTALEKIKKGEFDQHLDSYLSAYIASLMGPESVKVFSKDVIQNLAVNSPDLDSLVQKVKEMAVDRIIAKWEEIHWKSISSMPYEEIQKFYETEWRSSPKKLRETIGENIESSINIKREDQ